MYCWTMVDRLICNLLFNLHDEVLARVKISTFQSDSYNRQPGQMFFLCKMSLFILQVRFK